MASNSFGNLFRITTWGESHGPAMGVVIDGCPAGLRLDLDLINRALARRSPGSSPLVSPRQERDQAEILSGLFNGQTTGAPISILIRNTDAKSASYEAISRQLRPGHANYTYLEKYGIYDFRGGGRASARETAARVAAGAVAAQWLDLSGITCQAWLSAAGAYVHSGPDLANYATFAGQSPLFAPSAEAEQKLGAEIQAARADGDSVGGIVSFVATGLPPGLGDPIYNKLEANLASAMLSIPASRGFELGNGFALASLRGSQANDAYCLHEGRCVTKTNHCGGVLGGISTGAELYGRVAFKPTPSIAKAQASLDLDGQPVDFVLPPGSRHDPCVAVRAVPVVNAMLRLVLADALLSFRCARV